MYKRYFGLFTVIFCFGLPNVYSQSTTNIYVSDAGDFDKPPWQILKYDQNGENPEVFINTNLAWPQDILFIEDQGIVLVSNLNENNICAFDLESGAFIKEFATGISGPTRMKIGPDGLLYILQWSGSGRVVRYTLNGNRRGEFTNFGLSQSIGLDWDKEGNLYVSSYDKGHVKKYDRNGIDQGVFAEMKLLGPTNIYFNDKDELIVLDYNAGNIKRYNNFGNFLGIDIEGLNKPEGVAFLKNGDLLVGNGGTGAIKRYRDGNFVGDFIRSKSGGLKTPNAVVVRSKSIVSSLHSIINRDLVTPNFGRNFALSNGVRNMAKNINIYNSTGQFVDKLDTKHNEIWNADHLNFGYYYLVIENESWQRILVN